MDRWFCFKKPGDGGSMTFCRRGKSPMLIQFAYGPDSTIKVTTAEVTQEVFTALVDGCLFHEINAELLRPMLDHYAESMKNGASNG